MAKAAAYQPRGSGTPASPIKPNSTVATWLAAISNAQSDMKKYNDRCDRIRKRYRYDDAQKAKRRQFQMLWSNTEILKPATYAKQPIPAVEERNKTGNAMARLVSLVLERNLTFQSDFKNFDSAFKAARDDFILYARGAVRLRYYPVFEEADIPDVLGGQEAAEDDGYQNDESEPPGATSGISEPPDEEADETQQILKTENICVDFVQRDDFIHPFVRTWEELPWLAYRAFLSREEMIERFGDAIGSKVPLSNQGTRGETSSDKHDSEDDKALVYEIWNRVDNEVLWICDGWPSVCDKSEPYLKFKNFFPSPRPAYGSLTTDSLIPIPDYVYYQDQAEEINQLTARIGSLADSLKLVGFYPAGPQGEGSPEVERAVQPGVENRMIAVKSWAMFTEGGKGGAPIVWLPVDQVQAVLQGCVELRKQLIDDVYQITGISDILRGATEASETLGAQQLKAQWGGIRMRDRQTEFARLCRDTISMAGEIMCNVFQPQTLLDCADIRLPHDAEVQQAQMQAALAQQQWQQANAQAQAQGVPPPPAPPEVPDPGPTFEQFAAYLKDKVQVAFRIDIETDSTINPDESQEKQDRNEFIQATSQFITAWGPIVAQQPDLAPLAGELLLFGVRAFRTARPLEGAIEQFVKGMEQKAAQPPPQPQPDPTEQAKLELVKQQGQNQAAGHQATMEQQAQKHAQDMEQSKQEGAIKLATMQAEQAHKERTMMHQAAQQDAEAQHQAAAHQRDDANAGTLQKHALQKIGAENRANRIKNAGGAVNTAAGVDGGADTGEAGSAPPTLPQGSGDPVEDKVNELAQLAQEIGAALAQSSASQSEQQAAMRQLLEAIATHLGQNSTQQQQAVAHLASLIQAPKKLRVSKRGPDNRIQEAEIG